MNICLNLFLGGSFTAKYYYFNSLRERNLCASVFSLSESGDPKKLNNYKFVIIFLDKKILKHSKKLSTSAVVAIVTTAAVAICCCCRYCCNGGGIRQLLLWPPLQQQEAPATVCRCGCHRRCHRYRRCYRWHCCRHCCC